MAKTIKKGSDSPKTESIVTTLTSQIKAGDFVQQSYGWGKVIEDAYQDESGTWCVKLASKLVMFMSNDQPIRVKRYK